VLTGISGLELEYSNDGRSVAYVSLVDNTLWRCAADCGNRVALISPPLLVDSPRGSPDGQTIAFTGNHGAATFRIYSVPASGGALKQLTHGETGGEGESDPNWPPDGNKLIFSQAAGHAGIWIVDLKSGKEEKVPGSERLTGASLSSDGRFVTGISDQPAGFAVIDLTTHQRT
jgi:Tol biopolymer transport system component